MQPLRTLKEIAVKFSQDQGEDILPDSSIAHIARLRVDSVVRHGFGIWEVHGFNRLCAQVDEEYEPGAQVDCVEYLRKVKDVAEKLSSRLDVRRLAGSDEQLGSLFCCWYEALFLKKLRMPLGCTRAVSVKWAPQLNGKQFSRVTLVQELSKTL
jgi:hypothetical protein